MGSLKTTHDLAKELTIVKAQGKMTAKDFMNWLNKYYLGKVTPLILWDLTAADVTNILARELRELAKEASKRAHLREKGKSALVFSRDNFGLGRVFEILSNVEGTALEYRSFLDVNEAREWLGV